MLTLPIAHQTIHLVLMLIMQMHSNQHDPGCLKKAENICYLIKLLKYLNKVYDPPPSLPTHDFNKKKL